MKQMEEYKFGDWVSGVRHEAEVELEVIRNPEVDPEIIFIDDDADDTIKTKQVKNLGQLKPENRRINSEMVWKENQLQCVSSTDISGICIWEKRPVPHHRDCPHPREPHLPCVLADGGSQVQAVQTLHAEGRSIYQLFFKKIILILILKLDDPETWRAKELMESAPMTMSDLAIMEK